MTHSALSATEYLTCSHGFEIKSLSQEGTFRGYASTYSVDQQKDQIVPGAFRNSLKRWRVQKKWPFLLWHHHLDQPIGRWTNMREDNKGLFVEGELLLDVQKAREVYTLMKQGILDSLSIGFQPLMCRLDSVQKVRKIFQLHLVEVSIVTTPANTEANIQQVKHASQLFSA